MSSVTINFLLDIPPIEAWIRKEYLYDLKKHEGEFVEATIFAVKSIQGTALLFSAMLCDTGAVFDKLPISAIAFNTQAPHIRFDILQLWDCMSNYASYCEFSFLKGKKAMVLLKDGSQVEGIYRFTIDWINNGDRSFAEEPQESKCAHLIELDNGCLAAQPNNRILWQEPSSVAEPFSKKPDYKLTTTKWHCESHAKWYCEESDSQHYSVLGNK